MYENENFIRCGSCGSSDRGKQYACCIEYIKREVAGLKFSVGKLS